MSKHILYYFSGTGNSEQVARDLQALYGEEAEVRRIADYDDTPIEAEKIGIVFPVYYMGVPNMVARFLKKADFTGTPYLYAVATYGGTVGMALLHVIDMLEKRQMELNACFSVRMPDSCITYFNAPSEDEQQEFFAAERSVVQNIYHAVSAGETDLECAQCGKLARAVSKRLNRHLSHARREDRFFVVSEDCDGCAVCAAHCPAKNIVIRDGKPTFSHACENCWSCIQRCPKRALNYKNKTQKRTRYLNPYVNEVRE